MTLTGQPVVRAISPHRVRMTVSVPPPAAYMTTPVMGRAGHFIASALRVVNTIGAAATAPATPRVWMKLLRERLDDSGMMISGCS